MHDTFPLLVKTDFPAIRRRQLETLQANLGYRCNQSCLHCHVAASPKRTEEMSGETITLLLQFAQKQGIETVDLTGGAPDMNPHFRRLVSEARAMGLVDGADQDFYRRPWPRRPWPGPAPLPARAVTDTEAENTACPYSGKPVTDVLELDGRRFGFCNPFCRDKTVADPEAWPAFMALYRP